MTPSLPRRLLWRIEAAVAAALFALCRALGPVRASNLGGAVLRTIGPLLPVNRVAEVNLRLAFPDRDEKFRRATIRAMWDNLGRVAGELPNLAAIMRRWNAKDGAGWIAHGAEHIRGVANGGGPVVFFSGHFGNWEVLPGAAIRLGIGFGIVYRAIGNPHIDRMVRRMRAAGSGEDSIPLFPKGAEGARGIFAHLRRKGGIGLLSDQKMNDGVAAPLFGRPAMTAPAAAQLALRFDCPMIPVRTVRLGPARIGVLIEPPLPRPAPGSRHEDVALLTQAMNAHIEAWIRERPAEWLWLHRRFDKAIYRRA